MIVAAIMTGAVSAQQFELTNNFIQNVSFVTGTDRGREQNLDDNFAWMQEQGYTHLRFFGIFPNGYYTFPSPTLEANGFPTHLFFTSVLELLVQKADEYGIIVNFDGWEVLAESNYDTTVLGVGYITEQELAAVVQDVLSLGVDLVSEEQFGEGYIQSIQATTSAAGATHETTAALWWQYEWASLIADQQLGSAFSFYPYDQNEVDSVIGADGTQSYTANIGLLHIIMKSARHYDIPTSIAVGSFGTFDPDDWKNVLLYAQIVHPPGRFSIEESETDMLIWDPGFNFMTYVGNDVVALAAESMAERPIANLVYDLSPLYGGALYPAWSASTMNAPAIVNTFTSLGYSVVASVDSVLEDADLYYLLLSGGPGYPEAATLPDYVMPLLEGSKTVFVQPAFGIPDDNDEPSWLPLRAYFGLPSGDTQTLPNSIPPTVTYNTYTVPWGGIQIYLTPVIEHLPVDQMDTATAKIALSADVAQEETALIIRHGNTFLINSNLIHLGAFYILSNLLVGPLNAPALTDIVATETRAVIFAEHNTNIDLTVGWSGLTRLRRYDPDGNLIVDEDTDLAGDFTASLSQGELIFLDHRITIVCGDADNDQSVSVADAVFIVNYVFKGGPAPVQREAGDANCDGSINVADAVYVINYIFQGGDDPCCP